MTRRDKQILVGQIVTQGAGLDLDGRHFPIAGAK